MSRTPPPEPARSALAAFATLAAFPIFAAFAILAGFAIPAAFAILAAFATLTAFPILTALLAGGAGAGGLRQRRTLLIPALFTVFRAF